MAFLRRQNFIGAMPGIAAHLLPENGAQAAVNCKLVNGNLAPLRTNLTVNTPAKAGTKLSIYRLGNLWLHWISQVEVIKSAIAGDTTGRVYFTEAGEMRVTNAAMAGAGGALYPMTWNRVGVPAPDAALTATLTGTADDPDDFQNTESRSYVYAFVNAWGEEGPWSPASNIVDWNPGQSVTLSSIPASVAGTYVNVTGIRIYRRVTGAGYRYVKDAALGSGSTSDTVATAALGEEVQTADNYPPPAGMHSIVNHPGSFVVGAVGNEIAPSEAGLPYAFNPFNRQTIPYDIVGMGIVGQGVLIMTGAGLWYAAGTTPDSLTIEKVEIDQSCSSRQSIFDGDGVVGFASPDGLFAFGMGSVRNLTQGLFTQDQWRNMNPSSMICAYHDGKIVIFYDNGDPGGFILYPGDTPSKVDLSFHATAVYVDKETDTLFMMVGNNIVSFEGGATLTEASWKGRLDRLPRPVCPTVGRVRATEYPVTVKLHVKIPPSASLIRNYGGTLSASHDAGETLTITKTVGSAEAFRLPSGYLSDEMTLECVVNKGEVSEVVIAENMRDLRSV